MHKRKPGARRLWGVAILSALTMTGCTQNSAVNNAGPNAGAAAGQVVPPPRHAAMTPRTRLRTQPTLAKQIETIPGLKDAVVLQEENKVYVGASQYDAYSGRTHYYMRGLPPATKARIQQIVEQALPQVRSIRITTDAESADELRHYASYLQSGGNMELQMTQFHRSIGKIWPGARNGASVQTQPTAPNQNAKGIPTVH